MRSALCTHRNAHCRCFEFVKKRASTSSRVRHGRHLPLRFWIAADVNTYARTLAVSLALTGLVASAMPADASPILASPAAILLNVTAETCFECWNDPTLPNVTIDAQLTVVPETGRFFDPFYQDYVFGTFFRVLSITGMFNGVHAMSLAAAPNGIAPWVDRTYAPGLLYFAAAGASYRVISDHASILLQGPTGSHHPQLPLRWRAVAVPDVSSTFVLLALGVVGSLLVKRRAERAA